MATATHETEQKSAMRQMATADQEHHRQPAPGAADLYPNPFPPAVLHGLWISALAGGVLGLVFGRLLVTNTVVIDNWEQLYSLGSLSLTVLWTFVGIALGVAVGGVAAILMASPADQMAHTGAEDEAVHHDGHADDDDAHPERDRAHDETAAATDS